MYCCAWCQNFRNDEKEGSDGYCFIDGTDVRCEDVCDEFEIQKVKEGKRGNKMTNEEWLSGLSTKEKAKFLVRSCNFCSYDCDNNYCSENHCENGIKEWLNAKHEKPMPKIKAGDLLFYGKKSYYVAITPDKLVTLSGYVVVDLENAIRNDSITTIKRWKDGGLATIWRADND